MRRVIYSFSLFALEDPGYAFCGLQRWDDWGYCGLVDLKTYSLPLFLLALSVRILGWVQGAD